MDPRTHADYIPGSCECPKKIAYIMRDRGPKKMLATNYSFGIERDIEKLKANNQALLSISFHALPSNSPYEKSA